MSQDSNTAENIAACSIPAAICIALCVVIPSVSSCATKYNQYQAVAATAHADSQIKDSGTLLAVKKIRAIQEAEEQERTMFFDGWHCWGSTSDKELLIKLRQLELLRLSLHKNALEGVPIPKTPEELDKAIEKLKVEITSQAEKAKGN